MRTKVYYADTDAGGVVYYANYLRWLEMARSDWLEATGTSVADFVARGVLFAVVRVEIDYHVPAVLGNEVEITVVPQQVRRVRFTLLQDVTRCWDGMKLASARVTIACLTPAGKPIAIPTELAQEMSRQAPRQSGQCRCNDDKRAP